MRIDGSGNMIPQHIARAYGVTTSRAADGGTSAAPVQPGNSFTLAPSPSSTPEAGSALKPAAQSLIAGRAPGPIAFEGVSVPKTDGNVFHLYTRAADKIEAATAVQIGRTIDIKG